MRPVELEELKQLFADHRVWVSLGLIQALEPALDQSCLRVLVKQIPDNVDISATMSWSLTGPGSGILQFPQQNDLVLMASADGHPDLTFVISRLTSAEDTIPLRCLTGDMVIRSLDGTKANISSDTRVNIGRGGLVEESEPMVLGNVLKSALEALWTSLDTHLGNLSTGPMGIGNLGYDVPTHPTMIANIAASKAQIVLDMTQYLTATVTNILSQIAYTER
jgi:hypothetical protein